MPNPVKYAEEVLGVHEVWTEARERLDKHEALTRERNDRNVGIRRLREVLEDAELALAETLRLTDPDMKPTPFKELLRETSAADAHLTGLRRELATAEALRAEVEGELRHHELGLKVLSARMTELGGLLAFYNGARKRVDEPGLIG